VQLKCTRNSAIPLPLRPFFSAAIPSDRLHPDLLSSLPYSSPDILKKKKKKKEILDGHPKVRIARCEGVETALAISKRLWYSFETTRGFPPQDDDDMISSSYHNMVCTWRATAPKAVRLRRVLLLAAPAPAGDVFV
jgi:hypothetical protein